MYYRGAGAAIVVYDITKMHSFRTLKEWINELQAQGPQDIAIAIAGNKRDLEPQRVRRKEPVCWGVFPSVGPRVRRCRCRFFSFFLFSFDRMRFLCADRGRPNSCNIRMIFARRPRGLQAERLGLLRRCVGLIGGAARRSFPPHLTGLV